MKKNLLRTTVLLAVLLTCFASCTESGGENDNNHRHGGGEPDPEAILRKVSETIDQVSDIYMECESISDIEKRVDEIKAIDNVEDVYFSDIVMFVEIKDFSTVSFSFFPEPDVSQVELPDIPMTRQAGTRVENYTSFSQLGFERAVIIDQQLTRDWEGYKETIESFLERVGIETDINNNPVLSFYEDQIFDYDIVLIISHGYYDAKKKLHWLPLDNYELYNPLESFFSLLEHPFKYLQGVWYYNNYEVGKQITINSSKIVIDGKLTPLASFAISEEFITAQEKDFKKPGKAIVYNCACQSLMGGDDNEPVIDNNERDFAFAEAFVRRGAGVYFGYDETNGQGQRGGIQLLSNIASGQSILNAYKSLSDDILHDKGSKVKDGDSPARSWTADLLHYPEDHFAIENCCQIFPVIKEMDDSVENFVLNAIEPHNLKNISYIPIVDDDDDDTNNFRIEVIDRINDSFSYGFEVSATNDFNPSGTTDYVSLKLTENSVINNYAVSFSQSISKKDLNPETTYYYRAYLNDGFNKYYSEPQSFTTPSRIDQVVPEDIRQTMEPYITIYEGNTPPQVEGVYLMSPKTLTFDYTGQYDVGEKFADHYIKFTNQDYHNNTLDYVGEEVYDGRVLSKSEGPGAFISGTGDNFTVFFNVRGTTYFDDYNVDTTEALIISGTMTSTGVKDAEYSFVLISKSSDPKPHVINAGDFRVFKDSDGLAETASWPSGTRSTGYRVRNGKITTPWSMYSVRKK